MLQEQIDPAVLQKWAESHRSIQHQQTRGEREGEHRLGTAGWLAEWWQVRMTAEILDPKYG